MVLFENLDSVAPSVRGHVNVTCIIHARYDGGSFSTILSSTRPNSKNFAIRMFNPVGVHFRVFWDDKPVEVAVFLGPSI